MERPKARLTQHRQKQAEIHTVVGSEHLSKTVGHHVQTSSPDYTTMLKLICKQLVRARYLRRQTIDATIADRQKLDDRN